jgi:hypothetical protein
MTTGSQQLEPLRKRIRSLVNAKRRDMCWELGYFQVPMYVKDPAWEEPIKPYMLVCIDTTSRAVMGNPLLRNVASPEEFLSLLLSSMASPCLGESGPVLPRSVHLDNSAALKLLEKELGQLDIEFELVKQLPFLREFAGITEREFFSRQPGYTGRKH